MADIYNHYVEHTTITFDEEPITTEAMQARLDEVSQAKLPWLVAEADGDVVGFAYAGKWKGRCAYRFSVETTVYLRPTQGGKQIGTRLYEALWGELRSREVHAIMAGISLPNPASVALHEKFGMRQVAHFREVGFKFNAWVDVGYWQCVL